MIIVYSPEGKPERHFDMSLIRTSEAQILERSADMKWAHIKLGVRQFDPTAMRGVAWILLKREQPTLRWDDFDPMVDELASRFDDKEVTGYVGEILAMPEAERASQFDELRRYALTPAVVDAALEEAAAGPKAAAPTATEASPADD